MYFSSSKLPTRNMHGIKPQRKLKGTEKKKPSRTHFNHLESYNHANLEIEFSTDINVVKKETSGDEI